MSTDIRPGDVLIKKDGNKFGNYKSQIFPGVQYTVEYIYSYDKEIHNCIKFVGVDDGLYYLPNMFIPLYRPKPKIKINVV